MSHEFIEKDFGSAEAEAEHLAELSHHEAEHAKRVEAAEETGFDAIPVEGDADGS